MNTQIIYQIYENEKLISTSIMFNSIENAIYHFINIFAPKYYPSIKFKKASFGYQFLKGEKSNKKIKISFKEIDIHDLDVNVWYEATKNID